MTDVVKRIANIKRRLLGLKAARNVEIWQVEILDQSWPVAITLGALGSGSEYAEYEVSIVCAGSPIADVGVSGMPIGNADVQGSPLSWAVSGNTVTFLAVFLNTTGSTKNITPTIHAWALNGLLASIIRTV